MGCGRLKVPWTWALASCRGTSHAATGTPCQDYSRCILLGPQQDVLLSIVSDGAGSASHGRYGALLICRTIIDEARAYYRSTNAMPTDVVIWSWIDEVRDLIQHVALSRNIDARQFAATLICVLASEEETLILHVGDGAAVVNIGGAWSVPSWPESGEYASTTYFLTDDPAPHLRITRLSDPVRALAIFSDGIERLALSFAAQQAHSPFFETMVRPVMSGSRGQNLSLSAALATYLNGDAVNARTDDDKSLILAARI
jgi:hypothetical protein